MQPADSKSMLVPLRRTALIAAVFCFAVWIGLLVQYVIHKADDPLKSQRLAVLKAKLADQPQDDALKQEIRQLDLQLRQRYFHHLDVLGSGSWLLLGCGIVFLIAAKKAQSLVKQPPQPRRDAAADATKAKRAVVATATVIGAGFIALAFGVGTRISKPAEPVATAEVKPSKVALAAEMPGQDEYNRNWPRFRGPRGSGFSIDTNPPTAWDAKSGAGILWKSLVPVRGFNSPIVWNNRLFMSGGDARRREVVCFNADTGALVWRQVVENVPGSPAKVPEIQDATGFAAATMATDGRRVYAFFANYDLAAFDFDGHLLWSKGFGTPKNTYGHAASLITWRDRLILQLDQGEVEDKLSKLYAFNGQTGEIAWQTPRPTPSSWASPMVIEAAGKAQIVTLALPLIIGYAANDGTELWRFDGLGGEVTPSPAFGNNLVIVVSPSEKVIAIRPDGSGDVTKTHAAWTAEGDLPDITSPAANDEFVFTLSTSGMLTCFDIKDGKSLWTQDLKAEFYASPVIAAGRVYLLGRDGKAIVVEAGRQFHELARADVGEEVFATPAFAGNRIFIRGQTNLFCIGTGQGNPVSSSIQPPSSQTTR